MNRALNSIAIGAALVFAFAGWPQAAAAIAPITALPSIAAPENNEGSGSCLKRHRPLPSGAHAARKGASRKGKTASDNVANDLNAQELSRSGGPAPTQPGPAQGPGPRR